MKKIIVKGCSECPNMSMLFNSEPYCDKLSNIVIKKTGWHYRLPFVEGEFKLTPNKGFRPDCPLANNYHNKLDGYTIHSIYKIQKKDRFKALMNILKKENLI